MMNQEWFKDVLMITKDDDKGDDKKLKGQSKNEFKIESRTLQDSRGKVEEHFKIQEEG